MWSETPNYRFLTHEQLMKALKMKAQLENTQEEVAAGIQGVTSVQKGQKRPRKAILEFFLQISGRGTRHVPTCQAQVGPTPRGTKINNREDITFRGGELRFVLRSSPRGLRQPFLKIDAHSQDINSL